MLVIFLILFTKVIADSEEDKYVDLLPDEEKQQFIENVARRILKDVESKENEKQKQSGELSDEQLKKHTEFVKSILKQETDYAKRNKDEAAKDRDEKSESYEKDALDVKPLESEKIAIADDLDLDNLDLTLRNDRKGGNDEKSIDYIKVEIITDEPPIIKRSVQNDSSSSDDSVSDETTSETLERVQPETVATSTENINITTENIEIVSSTAQGSQAELTTISSKDIVSKNESSNNVELRVPTAKHVDSKTNEAIGGASITADSYDRAAIGIAAPKTKDSSESDDDDTKLKGLKSLSLRKLNNINDPSKENNTGSESTTTGIDENTLYEYNSVSSSDIEEFTTLSSLTEDTTSTESVTQNVNETTTAVNVNLQDSEGLGNPTTELSTITSTFTDEGTTDSLIETSTFKTPLETSTQAVTSTFKPISRTREIKIIDEDFTSVPKARATDDWITLRIETTTKTPEKPTTKIHSLLPSMEISSEVDLPRINPHKIDLPKIIPKRVIYDNIKLRTAKSQKISKPVEIVTTTDRNFKELEKVYFDNNYKVKMGKEYHVYEIPSNKSPFIMDEGMMTDQPYYVPVYNYSPNHAYFNPTNRLGPNPSEVVSKENLGTFSVTNDDIKDDVSEDIQQIRAQNVDMDYSVPSFDIKRKKFGTQQNPHGMHKVPQQANSNGIKRGYGKVNPEDYLDSDYYFGRIRKDNYHPNKLFPNSNENDHPSHSIQDLSLKDHVRAVRNLLFHQKIFGPITAERNGVSTQPETVNMKPKQKKHLLRTKIEIKNKKDSNDEHEKNIAIDYYFGREKPTPVLTDDNNDSKNNEHIQKVGYLKGHNKTKELYVMDDTFKDNVVKYIDRLNDKHNAYIQSDWVPATPMPIAETKSHHNKVHHTRMIDKEKKLNAAIIKRLKEVAKQPDPKENLKAIINAVAGKNLLAKPIHIISNSASVNPELNFKMKRQNDDVKIGVYLEVLKDMISLDNKALEKYDWLGTAVDIQASLQKLFELTGLVVHKEDVHPSDMEILKYVIFLHKLASEITEANILGSRLRKKLSLPKNKKKKLKPQFLKQFNRAWLYLRKEVPEVNETGALKNLYKFLMDVEDSLFDLHDAIKTVAKITKYKNQHWYLNLKELYLNTDEKHLLELLLHMRVSRLFGLIEDSAKSGLEDDYIQYMKKHRKEAKKTLEEMMCVMQIVGEINKIVE